MTKNNDYHDMVSELPEEILNEMTRNLIQSSLGTLITTFRNIHLSICGITARATTGSDDRMTPAQITQAEEKFKIDELKFINALRQAWIDCGEANRAVEGVECRSTYLLFVATAANLLSVVASEQYKQVVEARNKNPKWRKV